MGTDGNTYGIRNRFSLFNKLVEENNERYTLEQELRVERLKNVLLCTSYEVSEVDMQTIQIVAQTIFDIRDKK